MPSPSRRTGAPRERTKGQSLAEFALVLPVLLLLVLVAVDFGRALYGWVVLQNSARIAANYAGMHPEGWQDPQAAVQATYEELLENDLRNANCTALTATPPAPVFTDGPDTAHPDGPADTKYDVGDMVEVDLVCVFRPVTPIISAIVGSTFQLKANSEFRVRAGDITGLANPTEIPPPATPTPTPTATPVTPTPTPACALTASFTRSPNGNIRNGNTITFTSTSTATNCTITGYQWTFQLATPGTATSVGPHAVIFNVPSRQDVTVTLVVTSSTGSTQTATATYNVRP